MNWTDERVELLRKLWAEGLSASQIAAQLGGVSRNAVIGKVHRLKLSGRGRTTAAAPKTKKPVAATPGAPKPAQQRPQRPTPATSGANALQADYQAAPAPRMMVRVFENASMPASRKLALTDLNERTCKWPNGDPLAEDFSFCGNEAGEAGPYCGYHSKLAYQPVAERRRVR